VYLDGGPHGGSNTQLPDGSYWVQVTSPAGDVVLGVSSSPVVVVQNGEIAGCYQLSGILFKPVSNEPGYGTTPNEGGEYKVWLSTTSAFDPNQSKTDNFKVLADVVPPTNGGKITIHKYYDANGNGIKDANELYISSWQFSVTGPSGANLYFTSLGGTPAVVLENMPPGDYTVSETNPANWYTVGALSQTQTLPAGGCITFDFGDFCLGAGGGLTLGFWSNKNGQSLFGADDLALMVNLPLKNADLSDFNPTSYTAFRTWILAANAVQMKNMLSAQLAAMELNVLNGVVSGNAFTYTPGLGVLTVNQLMNAAIADLNDPNSTRAHNELLKNALDGLNNNRYFIQASPCAFTFP